MVGDAVKYGADYCGDGYSGPAMICPRCAREIHPWPLGYRARCSAREWRYCIRNDLFLDAIAKGTFPSPERHHERDSMDAGAVAQ